MNSFFENNLLGYWHRQTVLAGGWQCALPIFAVGALTNRRKKKAGHVLHTARFF